MIKTNNSINIIVIVILTILSVCYSNKINGFMLEKDVSDNFESVYMQTNLSNSNFNFFDFSKSNNSFFESTKNLKDELFTDAIKLLESTMTADKCKATLVDLEKIYSKAEIGQLNKHQRERLKFIHGNCNPVLLVPGLMATRLNLKISCKEFLKDEKEVLEMKTHCPDINICKNESVQRFVLWPSIFSDISMVKQFNINTFEWRNNNACMAYFLQYYNKPDSCPKIKIDDKEVSPCRYSPHVKIVPYGIEPNNENEDYSNKCGFGGINNIAYSKNISSAINLASKSSQGFASITSSLVQSGYEKGFSIIASPYDFKESECDNTDFHLQFNKFVNMLYENTGKKVIIIAHSYGNVNINYQLVHHPENKNLIDKIEHIINISGPTAGTIKADQLLNSGTNEFDLIKNKVVEVSFEREFQTMAVPFLRSSYQLRKISFNDIFNSLKYFPLKEAIFERKAYEDCLAFAEEYPLNKNCKTENKLFKLLPELDIFNDSSICQKQKDWKNTKTKYENQSVDNPNEAYPLYEPCNFSFRDYIDSPFAVVRHKNHSSPAGFKYSNFEKTQLLYQDASVDHKSYYICDQFNKSDYKGKCSDDYLINYVNIPDDFKKKTEEYTKNSVIYNKMKDIAKAMSNKCPRDGTQPKVNTTFIFNKSFETKVGFIHEFDEDSNIISMPTKKDVVYSGGDGTVQSEGVLYTALKALFDKKLKNLNHSINLVDFCSPISQDSEYSGFKDLNKPYVFLGCECKSEGKYNPNVSTDNCNHSSMLGDVNLIKYVIDLITSKNSKVETNMNYIKIVKKNEWDDHVNECNKVLEDIYLK